MRMLRRDDGSSLAAVLMVMMVVAALGVTSVQVARHSNDATTVDRERLQALNTAEAGVHDAMRQLENPPDLANPCQLPPTDGQLGEGRYHFRVQAVASPGACRINSWGWAHTGESRTLRHLEVTVELAPQGGFNYSLFASGPNGIVDVHNDGIVNGDVYADNLDQSKNNLTADNVVSPGDILTKNNATYSGTLWAGGRISLGENSTVAKSTIAAGGPIHLENNAVVAGDALATGNITLGNNAVVHGSISPNSSFVPAPPSLTKPTYTGWNPADYPSPTPVQGDATVINNSLSTNKANLSGVYYMNNPDGTVILARDTTITGDLTIVSEGKIHMQNNIHVQGSGHRIVLIALSSASDAVVLSNDFQALQHDVLIYTNGRVQTGNNVRFTGAIYADVIDVTNNFVVHYSADLANNPPPGFDFTGSSATAFAVVPTFWQEIVPGSPPD